MPLREQGPAGPETPHHARTGEHVLTELVTDHVGLSVAEAARRLQALGPNALPARLPPNPVLTFLRQFNDILIYALLASAIVTFLLGDWIGAVVIVAVTLINALVGVV